MFAINSAAAYARVGAETNVAAADPHQLILMLFDGAVLAINSAAMAIDTGDIPTKVKQITKAIEIITLGLQASLDRNSGGELADRLDALYEYMSTRLVLANAQSNTAPLTEVATLLRGLRDAWAQIPERVGDAVTAGVTP